MSFKITFDDSKLKKQLRDQSKRIGREMKDTINDLAKATATQCAARVQPIGVSNKTRDILFAAIRSDLQKVYMNTGSVFNALKIHDEGIARAYARAVNAGNHDEAESYAAKYLPDFKQGTPDNGEALAKSRSGPKRRVVKAKPVGVASNSLEALKTASTARAGLVKSGWLQAARSFGTTRIAKWLNKSSGLGSHTTRGRGDNYSVTIINFVRYASAVLSDAEINKAIANALKNTVSRLKRL